MNETTSTAGERVRKPAVEVIIVGASAVSLSAFGTHSLQGKAPAQDIGARKGTQDALRLNAMPEPLALPVFSELRVSLRNVDSFRLTKVVVATANSLNPGAKPARR